MTYKFINSLCTQTSYLIDFETGINIKSVTQRWVLHKLNLKESKTSWESNVVCRAVCGGKLSNKHQY